jgi:hypothetical protein
MGHVHNDVLDRGFGEIINTADFVHICAWSPTDYGEIAAGSASLGAAAASFNIVNVAAGRQLQMGIFGGKSTKTGTATSWAIVDDASQRILAVDLLPSPISVTQGTTWALPGVAILMSKTPAPPPIFTPGVASPALQGIAPGRGIGPRLTPSAGGSALAGIAPTLSKTTNVYVIPASGSLGVNRVAGALYHFDGDMIDVINGHAVNNVNITGMPVSLSATRSKFGTKSLYFPGWTAGQNYVGLDSDRDFVLPEPGYWTVDFWVWLEPPCQSVTFVDFRGDANVNLAVQIYGYYISGASPNALSIGGYGNLDGRAVGPNVPYSGWHHIAYTFSNTTIYIFFDGVMSYSHDLGVLSTRALGNRAPAIGVSYNGWEIIGYISELRILNGVCAWTSTFTPPTVAYSIADLRVSPIVTRT